MTDRGSSVLETLLMSAALLTLFSGVLSVLYFGFAKNWIEYTVYQGLLCAHRTQSSRFCEQEMNSSVHRVLPWGRITNLKLTPSGGTWKGVLQWRFHCVGVKKVECSLVSRQSLSRAKLFPSYTKTNPESWWSSWL